MIGNVLIIKVILIHKSDTKADPNNYRSIYITVMLYC